MIRMLLMSVRLGIHQTICIARNVRKLHSLSRDISFRGGGDYRTLG
jgi:hypothetical protein